MNAPLPLHRLDAVIASGDGLDVRHFRVSAAMSALFEVNVTAVSENPDIDFEAVAGHAASFMLRWGTGQQRTFTGIARTFEQIAAEERGLSTYRLTIVPALWLTTQRRNYRIFQHKSEIDIALEVLGQWGISPVLKLSGRYKKREYRVQYGETDFVFLSRLLEDAGVSFYFDAEADGALVFADEPQSGAARAPLHYRENPTVADREHATRLHITRDVRPGQYTLGGHDYRRPPGAKVAAGAQGGQGVEASLESYHFDPGAMSFESDKGESAPFGDAKGKYRVDEGEGAAVAQKRMDAARAPAKAVKFESNTYDLGPGTVVGFLDHPRSDLAPDKRYLVVGLEMAGEVNETWTCSCRALSGEVPYRPEQNTPRPAARGAESATVVGPAGEEIYTDELGRVRVQFHWDRQGGMDDGSSCWIHVSQPWAGAGFGASNLPRVGQEVLIDFLNGDPDRPVIVGRVFTGSQKTPYKLPEHKTRSTWKSSSTGQTGGYNEIMFEDLAGKELFSLQAEKDWKKLVKHDEDATVGHDRTLVVRHDEKVTVQNDRSLTVGNDETRHIGHDESETIGNDRSESIGHDDIQTVAHDRTITIGNDLLSQVAANEAATVGVNRSRFVGANESVQIGKNQTLSVGDNQNVKIGDNQSINIGGAFTQKVGKTSNETVILAKSVTVGVAYQLSVGGMMNTSVAGMSTEEVARNKKVIVGKHFELICGKSKLILEASGKVTIEGTEFVFKSSGPVGLQGKEVKVDGTHITLKSEEKTHIEGTNVKVVGEPIEMN